MPLIEQVMAAGDVLFWLVLIWFIVVGIFIMIGE